MHVQQDGVTLDNLRLGVYQLKNTGVKIIVHSKKDGKAKYRMGHWPVGYKNETINETEMFAYLKRNGYIFIKPKRVCTL